MLLSSQQVLGFDPYSDPLLMFPGNVVRLPLTFSILRASMPANAAPTGAPPQAYLDTEAILDDCERTKPNSNT